MIVDDQRLIIGSANINDRSMLGTRDSEIAALIEDDHKVQSIIGGAPCKVGKFPYEFRKELFKEHFGFKHSKEV